MLILGIIIGVFLSQSISIAILFVSIRYRSQVVRTLNLIEGKAQKEPEMVEFSEEKEDHVKRLFNIEENEQEKIL